MKILYHHRTRATDAQGVHILEIVQAFRELGHEVRMVSLVNAEGVRPSPGGGPGTAWWKSAAGRIPFFSESVQLAYNLWAVPWLVWKISTQRPDFVYERYSLFTFAGVLAAAICRTPLVLEVNSPLALEQTREGEIRAAGLAHWSERVICNSATIVLAVTGPLRRILVRNGVNSSKVVVMANGVNMAHMVRGEARNELAVALGIRGRTTVGFVGWFRVWHGLDFLIRVFDECGAAQKGAVLMLVGDGPAAPELRTMVAESGLGESVIFTGPVPHDRIPEYLALIDVAVQPAANEYCCPMKIIEYMAMGKPIVAPRQANIVELIRDGHEGLLFRAGDDAELGGVLSALIADGELRDRIGSAAARAIAHRRLFWVDNARGVISMLDGARTASLAGDPVRARITR